MKIEIVAAVVAGTVGVTGSAWLGSVQNGSEARESIVRLSTVAEVISKNLAEMRIEMRNDREVVKELMIDHHARLKVLESRQ